MEPCPQIVSPSTGRLTKHGAKATSMVVSMPKKSSKDFSRAMGSQLVDSVPIYSTKTWFTVELPPAFTNHMTTWSRLSMWKDCLNMGRHRRLMSRLMTTCRKRRLISYSSWALTRRGWKYATIQGQMRRRFRVWFRGPLMPIRSTLVRRKPWTLVHLWTWIYRNLWCLQIKSRVYNSKRNQTILISQIPQTNSWLSKCRGYSNRRHRLQLMEWRLSRDLSLWLDKGIPWSKSKQRIP